MLGPSPSASVTSDRIHTFDNGVRVYDRHLNPPQRERYERVNVHEVEEEPVFLELIDSLPEQGVFVALGSAIGYYAILARMRRSLLAIHSFEPLEMHREYMRENIELNGLDPRGLPIHHEAIAERDGRTWLRQESYSSALLDDVSLTVKAKDALKRFLCAFGVEGFQPLPRVSVPTLCLDSISARVGGRIDLLQMDVQGLEVDALRGGERTLASGALRTALISTHGPEIHARCRELLVAGGFTLALDVPDPEGQPDGMLVAHRV